MGVADDKVECAESKSDGAMPTPACTEGHWDACTTEGSSEQHVRFDLSQNRLHLIAKNPQILFDELVESDGEPEEQEEDGVPEGAPDMRIVLRYTGGHLAGDELAGSSGGGPCCLDRPYERVQNEQQKDELRYFAKETAVGCMSDGVLPSVPSGEPQAVRQAEAAVDTERKPSGRDKFISFDMEIVIDNGRREDVEKITDRLIQFNAVKNMFSSDAQTEEKTDRKIDAVFPSIKENRFIKQDRR